MSVSAIWMAGCGFLFSYIIIYKSYISPQRLDKSLAENSRLFKGLSRLLSGSGEKDHSMDAQNHLMSGPAPQVSCAEFPRDPTPSPIMTVFYTPRSRSGKISSCCQESHDEGTEEWGCQRENNLFLSPGLRLGLSIDRRKSDQQLLKRSFLENVSVWNACNHILAGIMVAPFLCWALSQQNLGSILF